MKFVRKALDATEKRFFAPGKPFAFLYPLYDAADTFFFTPNAKTSGTCAVRDCVDFKRMMITVVLALLPCALTGGTRARKAALELTKLLKEFRKVSVEEAKK